jgi:hypothetical protein
MKSGKCLWCVLALAVLNNVRALVEKGDVVSPPNESELCANSSTSTIQPPGITLHNDTGLRWTFISLKGGYALGGTYLNDRQVETPVTSGMLFLRNIKTGEERWLAAQSGEQVDDRTARFAGEAQVEGVPFSFQTTISLVADLPAARFETRWSVSRDLKGWEVCLAYHDRFAESWKAHMYPIAENAKFLARSPLTYVGIPSLLLYRDDWSLSLLFGIDPSFDYLNPTTWTGRTGLYFMDQVTAPQFRIGGGELLSKIQYSMPLQLVFSAAGWSLPAITDLMQKWVKLNDYKIKPFQVRTPDEALALFLEGRRRTTMWHPGMGYRLEEGDPESNFAYIGEQPLSAYFEYLIYETTKDQEWRKRCFEQMDFMLKAQQLDSSKADYGAMHTAYDFGKRAFDSDDRGRNVGYKPDLNAHIARYMLLTWQRVKNHEGVDRREWYQAATRAANWVVRQQNTDGGLPQLVETGTGRKSISHSAGRALPAFPIIYRITGDARYQAFAESLEQYTRRIVEGQLRFTGHHPDLPPDELEEASCYGIIEYWLDKFERTRQRECLDRAVADAYLAFLWACPKDLSWVKNPTVGSSAEQEHFLQYSIYCYQNRKIQCLHRLYQLTGIPLFGTLYDRITQSIFFTQVTEGDQTGAAHERIADPWLARKDYDAGDFNSMGTIYMSEQVLDAMLQLVEMGQAKPKTQ